MINTPFMKSALLTLLAILMMASNFAYASEHTPSAEVKSAVDSVIALLKDETIDHETRRQHLREVIGSKFDFKSMSQSILARNWRKATDDEKQMFIALFSRLLENTYVTAIETYTNEKVIYPGEKIKGNKALVDTLIVTSSVEIPVSYKLKNKKDVWRVYDVVIEGVSLVNNYRGSFGSIVKKEGIAGLLENMQKKIDALIEKQKTQTPA